MCCFGMSKLLANKLVLLNYGMDKSDSKTVCKSPLMRTWRKGLKPGFFSWLMLVVVWVLNDDLASVLLFDTLGSFSVCVIAAAMLIAVVFSYLRRDLVCPALFGVASPCWQHLCLGWILLYFISWSC